MNKFFYILAAAAVAGGAYVATMDSEPARPLTEEEVREAIKAPLGRRHFKKEPYYRDWHVSAVSCDPCSDAVADRAAELIHKLNTYTVVAFFDAGTADLEAIRGAMQWHFGAQERGLPQDEAVDTLKSFEPAQLRKIGPNGAFLDI